MSSTPKSTGGQPTLITIPEKVALANVRSSPIDSPRRSSIDSPRSFKSDNPFDTDVEALAATDTLDNIATKTTTNQALKSDCQVWPSKGDWKQRAKAAKARNMKRSCNCLAGLSRRNKIIAKVLIILLIVGVGIGVGFGVSKPLGASIWGDKNH